MCVQRYLCINQCCNCHDYMNCESHARLLWPPDFKCNLSLSLSLSLSQRANNDVPLEPSIMQAAVQVMTLRQQADMDVKLEARSDLRQTAKKVTPWA